MRYFRLLSVQGQTQVIKYIADFPDFRQPCILKMASSRAKRTQIRVGGEYVFSVYVVVLTVKYLRSV